MPKHQAQSVTEPATEDDRWRAVQQRDRAADGLFLYAVRTTGVYCRPSCGARLPRRANVTFHASCSEAEAAGFRPCKRCRPNEPSAATRRNAAVVRACRLIEQSEATPSLGTLAAATGLSRFYFQRLFKEITGVTPRAYAAAQRGNRVRAELRRGGPVTAAIYAAGFGSSGRFYAEARKELGMVPAAFRAGGRDTTIRFAVGECSLGSILVAASARGVCAILLGDAPEALVRDLHDRFPQAELQAGGADFDLWVAKVVGFVDAPRIGLDLPLDIRGTAFQRRVWQALQTVPTGTTIGYAELAAKIGAPSAARAVASACAANALAVAIPCHRGVRADGNLSGYRWGIERKRALLERERG